GVGLPGSAWSTGQMTFTIAWRLVSAARSLLAGWSPTVLTGGNRGNGGLLAFHLCSLCLPRKTSGPSCSGVSCIRGLLLLNLVFHLLAPGRIRKMAPAIH